MDVSGHTLEFHVTVDLLDEDEAGLGPQSQFGLFRHNELKISLYFVGLRRGKQGTGIDVDAVAHLFDFNGDFAWDRSAGHHDFGIFPGFHLNAAVHDVVENNDGMVLHGKMAFLLFRAGRKDGGGRTEEQAGTEDDKRTPMNRFFLVPH
jgi:hypothetical protein